MFDVEAYLPYIKATVSRFIGYRASNHYEDLVQEGVVALLVAYKGYNVDNPVSFITYSRRALYGALTNYMRSQKIVVKKKKGKPVNGEAVSCQLQKPPIFEEEQQGTEREELLVDDLPVQKMIDITCRATRLLNEDQFYIYTQLFVEGRQATDIAKELGVTRQAINSRSSVIINKLKRNK